MRCPFCGADNTQVKDSRSTEGRASVRRRRSCTQCSMRFTTHERIHLREMKVVKRDGKKVSFDRDKLERSLLLALRKRNMTLDQIEQIVGGIVRRLESTGNAEIQATSIGSIVMSALKDLDQVAYVRFASVYLDFQDMKDFERLLRELRNDDGD